MQSFILVGQDLEQEKYINSFIDINKIPSYLIQRFEKLKIAEARLFKTSLSTKLPEGSRRLIIISDPTLEAQNAILKTIEELAPSNFVFFSVRALDDLLSTIVSRSQVVRLEFLESVYNQELEARLEEVLTSTIQNRNTEILSFVHAYGDVIDEKDIEGIILALRNLLRKNIDQKKSYTYFKLLKNISQNMYQITSYNVQKKLFLENMFLSNYS